MKMLLQSTALTFTLLVLFYVSTVAQAQEDKSKRPSPPDKVTGTVGTATVTIDYSRPSVKGRKIFGEKEPYGKVWRTGANEATTFEVNHDLTVEGQPLPAGKYGLFTIPGQKEWVVIFNKEPNQWGAFKYDDQKDALRVKVKPQQTNQLTETLTFSLDKSGLVAMRWENIVVAFKVSPAGNAH